uniref:Uncharacterized protein n=1 Tax=Xenopus tropicalis TaxID=8364 RepID=A0A1B8Y2I5_XENTR
MQLSLKREQKSIWSIMEHRYPYILTYSTQLQKLRSTFTGVKRKLRELNLTYAMTYPAKLKINDANRTYFFTTPEEAIEWIETVPPINRKDLDKVNPYSQRVKPQQTLLNATEPPGTPWTSMPSCCGQPLPPGYTKFGILSPSDFKDWAGWGFFCWESSLFTCFVIYLFSLSLLSLHHQALIPTQLDQPSLQMKSSHVTTGHPGAAAHLLFDGCIYSLHAMMGNGGGDARNDLCEQNLQPVGPV